MRKETTIVSMNINNFYIEAEVEYWLPEAPRDTYYSPFDDTLVIVRLEVTWIEEEMEEWVECDRKALGDWAEWLDGLVLEVLENDLTPLYEAMT